MATLFGVPSRGGNRDQGNFSISTVRQALIGLSVSFLCAAGAEAVLIWQQYELTKNIAAQASILAQLANACGVK